MNRKEFKHAMLCGLGSCVLACRKEPERYRQDVLWGCTHLLAYDAQCEGSRARFLHELVSCYPEASPFRDAATAALQKKSTSGWFQLQIEEFLHYLADDGDEIAQRAIWDKYEQMYSALRARKRLPNCYFRLRDDYTFLAIDLGCEVENTFRIASDMGRLMRENPIYDADDFDQFFWHVGEHKQITALRRFARTDENAAYFLKESEEVQKRENAAFERIAENYSNSRNPRNMSEEEFLLQAERYVNETEPKQRAELLDTFTWHRPFPLDPEPILADALSENEHLSYNAWDALHIIRSPKVREFALDNLEADSVKLIPLLVTNYAEGDRPLLESLLAKLPKGEDGDDNVHTIGRCVNDLHDAGLKAPAWILRWVYDNDRCSFCREYVVREMGRRRLLTDELLNECLYDANDDIRKYARKRMAKNDK